MSEGEHKTEAPKDHPAMGQIVGYLKDYPFLLITIAGLLILSGILIFEIEKLKEFKWLIYAVVLVPLAIQFLIEFRKMTPTQERPAAPPATLGSPPPPSPAPLPPSYKAWVSVGIGVLMFGVVVATPEAELYDPDFALGFLALALVAAAFAFAGMSDINHQRAGGKGMAIAGIVLSSVLLLAAIGWMTEDEVPTPAGNAVAPILPPSVAPILPPSGTAMPPPAALPPPSSPARPGMPLLDGRYQLLAYRLNGIPQTLGGTMAVSRHTAGQYQWQAQLVVNDPSGPQTFAYAGQFLNRGGQWFIRIAGSSDPDWEDIGEVPMEFVFDGRSAAFGYVYDGELVQSAWVRSE